MQPKKAPRACMIRRILLLLLLLLHIALIYGNQLLDPNSTPVTCAIHGLVLVFVVTGGAEECDEVVDTKAHVLKLVTGQCRRCQGALLLLKLEKVISRTIHPHWVKRTSRMRCSTVSGTESL